MKEPGHSSCCFGVRYSILLSCSRHQLPKTLKLQLVHASLRRSPRGVMNPPPSPAHQPCLMPHLCLLWRWGWGRRCLFSVRLKLLHELWEGALRPAIQRETHRHKWTGLVCRLVYPHTASTSNESNGSQLKPVSILSIQYSTVASSGTKITSISLHSLTRFAGIIHKQGTGNIGNLPEFTPGRKRGPRDCKIPGTNLQHSWRNLKEKQKQPSYFTFAKPTKNGATFGRQVYTPVYALQSCQSQLIRRHEGVGPWSSASLLTLPRREGSTRVTLMRCALVEASQLPSQAGRFPLKVGASPFPCVSPSDAPNFPTLPAITPAASWTRRASLWSTSSSSSCSPSSSSDSGEVSAVSAPFDEDFSASIFLHQVTTQILLRYCTIDHPTRQA